MTKMTPKNLICLIATVFSGSIFPEGLPRQTLLQIYAGAHENYVSLYGAETVPMPRQFAGPVAKIFGLMFARAGMPMVPYEIRIVNDANPNASTMIGPYFTISTGMLAAIETRASTANEIAVPEGIVNAADYRREVLLAGVISHEIGHFLAEHGLQELIAHASGKPTDRADIERSIKRSQQHEFEADRFGYQLMDAAGYVGANLYHTLRILHDDMQKKCQSLDKEMVSQCHSYSYADTHPATHARLAQFKTEHKKFHEEMLQLEIAVAMVNEGHDLIDALRIIETELKHAPHNAYFLRVRALAKHKRWLETVPLAEQQLRSILSVPAFHDQMASGKRKSRGAMEIPGDKHLYFAAKKAYDEANAAVPPPAYFSSAQLTLLAYDPDEKSEALRKSNALVAASPELPVLNNHAVILFLSGQYAEALGYLALIVQSIDREYMKITNAAPQNSNAARQKAGLDLYARNMRVFDTRFVHTDFTPLLNLALMLAMQQPGAKSKDIAAHYLKNYDSDSDWARRLAALTAQTAPERRNIEDLILKRLNMQKATLKPIGKLEGSSKSVTLPKDASVHYLDDQRARIVTAAAGVRGITVYTGSPLKIDNQIGIGSSRGEVEKLWGKSERVVNGYMVYGSAVVIGIRYDNDRVAEFTLQ